MSEIILDGELEDALIIDADLVTDETLEAEALPFSIITLKDYEKLENLPSINGTTLLGNYDEIDPTVPDWAKNENKPDYTAPEVGAVDRNNAMTFVDVKKAWDTFFK